MNIYLGLSFFYCPLIKFYNLFDGSQLQLLDLLLHIVDAILSAI